MHERVLLQASRFAGAVNSRRDSGLTPSLSSKWLDSAAHTGASSAPVWGYVLSRSAIHFLVVVPPRVRLSCHDSPYDLHGIHRRVLSGCEPFRLRETRAERFEQLAGNRQD